MSVDLICHCHLRWDFVWQRPQHLMTRMARHRRVFFLEDALPLPDGETEARLETLEPRPNLVVVKPRLLPHTGNPEHDRGVDRRNGEVFVPMIREALRRRGFDQVIHWFYTPMAYWLSEEIPHVGIVYDCMDELSMFKNPPPGIQEKEQALLDYADIVFTGGRSLYLGKVERHPNVHMFPSGVEVDHFGKACSPDTTVPDDIAALPHPRFSYTGVIDERLDLPLLGQVASGHPEWQFIMVGPVVKIDPGHLPSLPNIHYLGQKPYAELPAYLKGTDVAIMPFAINDATKFISPTKTLEYMAARRPVVSTPIADVVAYYSRIVYVARSTREFETACEQALEADEERMDEGVTMARSQTWDSIADQMNALLEKCVIRKEMCETGSPDLPG